MFVHDEILPVSQYLRPAWSTFCSFDNQGKSFSGGIRKCQFAGQYTRGIKVHVFAKPFECLTVSSYLDQRGNRTTDNTSAASYKQHDLCPGRDEIHDPLRIVRVGVSELHEVIIGYAVHQPQTRAGRSLRYANHSLDRPLAALGEGTHALF